MSGVSALASGASSPTGRRRQRSSSRATPPAEAGPSSTSRSRRLRSSGGSRIGASAALAPGRQGEFGAGERAPVAALGQHRARPATGSPARSRCGRRAGRPRHGAAASSGDRAGPAAAPAPGRAAAERAGELGVARRRPARRPGRRGAAARVEGGERLRRGGAVGRPGFRMQRREARAEIGRPASRRSAWARRRSRHRPW